MMPEQNKQIGQRSLKTRIEENQRLKEGFSIQFFSLRQPPRTSLQCFALYKLCSKAKHCIDVLGRCLRTKNQIENPSLRPCPNVSTTPITAMGCRQCLSLSVVQLKGKHCRKPHCCNGIVGTLDTGHFFHTSPIQCLICLGIV